VVPRALAPRLIELTRTFPAVFLTGPRQAGKTTLARSTFPDFGYLSLEDLDTCREAGDDPRGFLRRLEDRPGHILDEVQRAPALLSYLQRHLDERRGGPVVLTGSQHFLLSERISQSLAGRVAILELLPFSLAELSGRPPFPLTSPVPPGIAAAPPPFVRDELLVAGQFPRIHAERLDPRAWLDGYVRTYVERDVRSLTNVGDLETFTRFLALCAGRTGQLLNASSLGADAGVSHATARRWISVLQASYVVELLRPHHASFSKRMVKSPKLYFVDSGLLSYLLGIRSAGDLAVHPLRGAVFECFVVSELRKHFLHRGERPPLWFWRDTAGHEVDVIVDLGTRRIPVEAKSGETVAPDAYRGLDFYAGLAREVGGILVYGGDECRLVRNHEVRAWWACA